MSLKLKGYYAYLQMSGLLERIRGWCIGCEREGEATALHNLSGLVPLINKDLRRAASRWGPVITPFAGG